MSIEWFQLNDEVWEGLDLRFTRFHFTIVKSLHPSAPKLWSLGLCSPDYENTCVPIGTFNNFELAQSVAADVTEILYRSALPEF